MIGNTFICGPARHGKDTVARILAKVYGLSYQSSSVFCMRLFLRKALEDKYDLRYDSEEDCFEDRVNHRHVWYNEITAYNRGDKSRLARELFSVYPVYVGIRDREEFLAAKPLSMLAIWVDAQPRLEITGEADFLDTCVRESDCDFTICNDGDWFDLNAKVCRIFTPIMGF